MLLSDLLKHTPDIFEEEQKKLQQASAKIKEIADFLNDSKRKSENSAKVLDIQNRLIGNDVRVLFVTNDFFLKKLIDSFKKKG